MECPAWFFVQSASEKLGHLNSLLHPPFAISPSTFFHPYLLLVCLPHSFFFSLFVPPPRGRAQSDKVTDRHFSCHQSLWLCDTRVADWQGAWRYMCVQTGLGVEGLGWCKNDGVCLSGCFVGWWWCVCEFGGGETGRSVDRMGELRRRSVRVKKRGVGLLGLETELRALALSHSLWQFGGFTLSCSALFVCAPLLVSHVKMRPHCPHCPLVTVGHHSSQNQGKDGHWQLGLGLQTRGAQHRR